MCRCEWFVVRSLLLDVSCFFFGVSFGLLILVFVFVGCFCFICCVLCCVMCLTSVVLSFAVPCCSVLLVRGSRCCCLLLVVVSCLSFVVLCSVRCALAWFVVCCLLLFFLFVVGHVSLCVYLLWFVVLYLGRCCLLFVCDVLLVGLRLRVVFVYYCVMLLVVVCL